MVEMPSTGSDTKRQSIVASPRDAFIVGGAPYPRLENRLYQLFPQIFQLGKHFIPLTLIAAETTDTQPFDTTFLPFIKRNKCQKGNEHRNDTNPPFGISTLG